MLHDQAGGHAGFDCSQDGPTLHDGLVLGAYDVLDHSEIEDLAR